MIALVLYGMFIFAKERGWLPKKSLKGKHVFLTGAGSGIGRETAILLARQGCKLSISDLNEASVIETKKIIQDKTKNT